MSKYKIEPREKLDTVQRIMNGIESIRQAAEKEYVILSQVGEGVSVSTEISSSQEAYLVSKDNNVIVIEENSYVYGSKKGNKHNKHENKRSKNKKQKKTTKRESKNSSKEWNIQAIKAEDNAFTYSGDRIKVAIIDSGVDYTEDIDVIRQNFIPEEEGVSVIYEDTCGHARQI